MTDLPIACELTAPALRQRKAGLLASVRRAAHRAAPHPDGLELEFPAGDAVLADLAELIRLETQCCPFLRFDLRVGPRPGPTRLVVTGPPGTREFLSGLGWSADPH